MEQIVYLKKSDWEKVAQEFNKEDLAQVTELSTDESIEERALKLLFDKKIPDDEFVFNDDNSVIEIVDLLKQFATEQSLIEQMRAKEFAEWCSINSYYYSTVSKGWHTPFHIHEFFTTEELFNKFTNQKQNG